MPQARRRLSLTPDLVARVERTEPDPGPDPGTEEHTADDLRALADAVLARHPGGPLRIFAYGSLIWAPEFEVRQATRGRVHGWHRSFCLRLTRWRGTRELPALMMALDRGGSCAGVVYEVDTGDLHGQIVRLLERELDGKPATNVPRWLGVGTAQGPVTALAFVVDPAGPAYAGRLPLDEVARITARAAGHWGSAAIYLQRTVAHLEENGIHDRNLWRLQKLVAERIRDDIGT
jgi:cation transport protein ChaC